MNRYIYAGANPINLVDPSGAFTIGVCANALAGFGFGVDASACAAVGYSGSAGFSAGLTETAGAPNFVGAVGSVGVGISGSNANRVSDLGGPFAVTGGSEVFLATGA